MYHGKIIKRVFKKEEHVEIFRSAKIGEERVFMDLNPSTEAGVTPNGASSNTTMCCIKGIL